VARGAVGEINSKAIKTKWQKLSERDKRRGIYGRNRGSQWPRVSILAPENVGQSNLPRDAAENNIIVEKTGNISTEK
jgi:hypothetical protein